jgi:YVTN family beta-propeller protein
MLALERAMKPGLLAASAAGAAMLSLLPVGAALAITPAGYTVTGIDLPARVEIVGVDSATGAVYVGEAGTASDPGTVTVIDGASQSVLGSIAVPSRPYDIAVDSSTDTVYVSGSSGLTVIDGATDEVVATLASVGGQIAVDPATDTVYASTAAANDEPGLAVIDGATNLVTATIPLPQVSLSLAVNATTNTIYSGARTGTLTAIDGATNAVTGSAQFVGAISGLAADPATGSVYAVDTGSNTVYVVDDTTLTTTASITGCPYHVIAAAADPASGTIFVTSYGNLSAGPADGTCVISASTNTVAETFPRGGVAVAADDVTGTAYIAAWNPLYAVWVATPSSADELSPLIYGFGGGFGSPTATLAVGIPSTASLLDSALPAATITETGALPDGITMSSSGALTGTPDAGTVGTYPIIVSASNGVGLDSTASLTVAVDIAPAVTSPSQATFQTGVPGTFTVQATGDPAPTLQVSQYPSWMTYTPRTTSSGVLSGTPPRSSGGTWQVLIWAENGYGSTPTQFLTIVINQPPAIVAASHATFRVGRTVRYRISSTGYPVPMLREGGRLPSGLRFQTGPDGTAVISGEPVRGDKGKRYEIKIIASNHVGRTATQTVVIRIR